MSDLGALGMIAIIFGIPLLCTITPDRKKKRNKPSEPPPLIIYKEPPKKTPQKQEKPAKPTRPGPSPETIEAMHKQADAERAIAEALERKALYTSDPVKRARIDKQAANSWLRFNKILDQIDKLTPQ